MLSLRGFDGIGVYGSVALSIAVGGYASTIFFSLLVVFSIVKLSVDDAQRFAWGAVFPY